MGGSVSSKDMTVEFQSGNIEDYETAIRLMLDTIRIQRPLTNICVIGLARDGKSSLIKAMINAVEYGTYHVRPETGDDPCNMTKELQSYSIDGTNIVMWDTSGMQKEQCVRNESELSIYEKIIEGYAVSGETVLRDAQGYMVNQPLFREKPRVEAFMHGYFCAVRAEKDFADDKESHDFLKKLKEAHDQEKLTRRSNEDISNKTWRKFNISRAYVVTGLDALESGDEFPSADFYSSSTMNRAYEEVRSSIGFDSDRVHRFRHLPESQMEDVIRRYIILRPLYKLLNEIDRERNKYVSLQSEAQV